MKSSHGCGRDVAGWLGGVRSFPSVELGSRAGIPQATISRIENHVVSPTLDTLEPLIRTCGMELQISEPEGIGVDQESVRRAAEADSRGTKRSWP